MSEQGDLQFFHRVHYEYTKLCSEGKMAMVFDGIVRFPSA